jgi:RecA-family ATPase
MEEVLAGKLRPIVLPWKVTNQTTRMLIPRTLACVCGDPGSGKSFWMLQAAIDAYSRGHKVAIYELEEDRNYHLSRALAMLSGNSRVTDLDWCEQNGDLVRRYIHEHRQTLEAIGRMIWDAPEEQTTLEQLREWIAERAREGYRLICIDPVTAAGTKKDPWVADQEFVLAAKTIARQFDACVVLVTHPKKGKKHGGGALDDLAGGAAYQRFPQTVVWLERNDKDTVYNVQPKLNSEMLEVLKPDRLLYVSKARNGIGAGKQIAFDFSPESLLFAELGVVRGKNV